MKRPARIRAYRHRDLDQVMRVFQLAVWDGAVDYTAAQRRAWAPLVLNRAGWKRFFTQDRGFVAVNRRQVVGFTSLAEDGHINLLYVHPEYMRQGIALSLLKTAELHAQGARLYTEASLTARPAFERAGFTTIAPQAVSLRGQIFVNFRMEKRL